jgi:signal transduction histidine kinase
MRERIEKLGGELGYESAAGGFMIEMRIPLDRPVGGAPSGREKIE